MEKESVEPPQTDDAENTPSDADLVLTKKEDSFGVYDTLEIQKWDLDNLFIYDSEDLRLSVHSFDFSHLKPTEEMLNFEP